MILNFKSLNAIFSKIYTSVLHYLKLFSDCWLNKLFFFFKTDPNEKRDEDTGPKLDDLGFWDKLVALVASVIEEDRNSYAPVLSQFPAELNIGQVNNYLI